MAGAQLTMSSREIADLVNSRHDDVKRSIARLAERGVIQLPPMAEVKNHLGQTVSEFRIGKRDSYVIVAQLSPEFTARLVDRWQELESGAALPASASVDEIGKVFAGLKRIARTAGLLGNQAVLAAAKGTRKIVGTDPLALVDATHLTAPQNEALITPTEIGNRLGGVSGKKVNDVLTGEGFQTQHRDRRQRVYYEPTPKGIEAGGVMSDTGKKHGDGTPVRQLRWASRIVELLRSLIGGRA